MRAKEFISEQLLYRGDASKIDRFDSSKTGFLALFGAGIYLTDDPTIAADYTLKGSEHIIFSSPEAKTPRELIGAYLGEIIKTKFKWIEQIGELKQEALEVLYADPDYRKASDPPYDRDAVFKITKQHEGRLNIQIEQLRTKMLAKAKREFASTASDMRIIKDTAGKLQLVKKDRDGYLTTFNIPDEYIAKTLHAERPLPDKVLMTIRDLYLNGRDPSTKLDMRNSNGEFCSFDEWVNEYKSGRGIMYAWRSKDDGENEFIEGNGQNPDLDTVWNGTHYGGSWFYRDFEKFRIAMQELGYVGLEYDGGKRVGAYVRGGGGTEHRAYVFWNDDDIERFKVKSENISANDPEIDPKAAKGIRNTWAMKRSMS